MAASNGCRKRLSQISILSILHAVVPREIKDNAYAKILEAIKVYNGRRGSGAGPKINTARWVSLGVRERAHPVLLSAADQPK